VSTLSERQINHIFERLRSGVVPEHGLDAFAVGIERQRGEIARQLELVRSGEGSFKLLRGGYGCGKTFMARLAIEDAKARNFVTSFVVVSDNDLHFHRFDELYRKVVENLSTRNCDRGALGDIIDRWIAQVEQQLEDAGADPDAKDFDDRVRAAMNERIQASTQGKTPEDFGRALRAIFDRKQSRKLDEASALLSWLSGSEKVPQGPKKDAGLKGEIGSKDAMAYLRGILEVVKAAGYAGLVIVIDEAETILRMRQDVRGKTLNGMRQIIDMASEYHQLLWIFTGTPEFFDTPRGVKGLAPLHDRVQFNVHGGMASMKQPQLQLTPFDAGRLRDVALRLRAIYPAANRSLLERAITSEFIERLVQQVTAGFKGDVGVVPRQFLRQLVDLMDLADDGALTPGTFPPFEVKEPTEAEQRAVEERPKLGDDPPEPGEDKGYEVEF
jgi:hypothetical protein